jgi:hypothetical protein
MQPFAHLKNRRGIPDASLKLQIPSGFDINLGDFGIVACSFQQCAACKRSSNEAFSQTNCIVSSGAPWPQR